MKPRNFPDKTPKNTLRKVELHSIPSQGIECLLEVFKVGFSFSTFHEHVIHIDLHILAYLLVEHLVYQSLVRGTYILWSKWHDFIVI